jgi:hypothetical protein
MEFVLDIVGDKSLDFEMSEMYLNPSMDEVHVNRGRLIDSPLRSPATKMTLRIMEPHGLADELLTQGSLFRSETF